MKIYLTFISICSRSTLKCTFPFSFVEVLVYSLYIIILFFGYYIESQHPIDNS